MYMHPCQKKASQACNIMLGPIQAPNGKFLLYFLSQDFILLRCCSLFILTTDCPKWLLMDTYVYVSKL